MRALLALVLLATQDPAFQEKLALADRLFVAGDFRNALFAYQDAVYLAPDNAQARVRLGRAYAALEYPDRAKAQYEKALQLDPTSLEARRALEELGFPAPPLPQPAPPAAQPAAPPARLAAPPTPLSAPEEIRGPSPASAPAVAVAPSAPVAMPPSPIAAAGTAVAAAAPARAPAPPEPATPTAAQRYRAALDLMAKRDYASAVRELDQAITLDPRFAAAYVARASAQFGLAKYREAADDYKAALGLDPAMATPIYGLAECRRLLGDAGAAELYERYAQSQAPDVREDLRALAKKRAAELRKR